MDRTAETESQAVSWPLSITRYVMALIVAAFIAPGIVAAQGSAASEAGGSDGDPRRHWLLHTDGGVGLSAYFGEGWREALNERTNDDSAVPDSQTSSALHLGAAFGFLLETDITPVHPAYTAAAHETEGPPAAASDARFFPDALRIGTGISWARLGGQYEYSDAERTGTQTIARNYLVIPVEAGFRGIVFDWPLRYTAALGPTVMIPVGGVLVRTEIDGDTEEDIYQAEAFRSVVPGFTVRLGLDYPLGPGQIGLTVRANTTLFDIEPGSGVWLWDVSPRISYSISARKLGALVGSLF